MHKIIFTLVLLFTTLHYAQASEKNIYQPGDTLIVTLENTSLGNVQWQYSNDLRFWRNLKERNNDSINFIVEETGFIRAKFKNGMKSFFSDTTFFYVSDTTYSGPKIEDNNNSLKIEWKFAIAAHLIDRYTVKINDIDTIIELRNRDNTLTLPRKNTYYGKKITIEAITENQYVVPEQTVTYNNDYSLFFDTKNRYIAHRGLSHSYPENTAIAFEKAKEAGFELVECDVWLTQDDIWVLVHDKTIERTSNGKGEPGKYYYNELKSFNFGYQKKFGDAYPQSIISLEVFLVICKEKKLKPIIEIKEEKFRHLNLIDLLRIINSQLQYNEYAIQSTEKRTLNHLRRIDKEVILGLVSEKYKASHRYTLGNLYPAFYNIEQNKNLTHKPLSNSSNSNIYSLFTSGIYVCVWTVNDPTLLPILHEKELFILTDINPFKQ